MHLGAVPSTRCGVAAAVDDDEFGHTRAGPVDKTPLFLSWRIASTSCCSGQSLSCCLPQYSVMKFQYSTRTTLGKYAPGCGTVKIHSSMVCTFTSSEALVELGLVSFESNSQGQLAMVIYEWSDYQYLGKVTSEIDEYLPVSFSVSPVPQPVHTPC